MVQVLYYVGNIFLTKRSRAMPFKKGEVYQCPDETCGCEVTVTKGAPSDCSGTQDPTCCCGKTMVKKNK